MNRHRPPGLIGFFRSPVGGKLNHLIPVGQFRQKWSRSKDFSLNIRKNFLALEKSKLEILYRKTFAFCFTLNRRFHDKHNQNQVCPVTVSGQRKNRQISGIGYVVRSHIILFQ